MKLFHHFVAATNHYSAEGLICRTTVLQKRLNCSRKIKNDQVCSHDICILFLPFLTGVFGCPTTVANVETVAVAPVCTEFLCPLFSCFDSSSDVPRQLF